MLHLFLILKNYKTEVPFQYEIYCDKDPLNSVRVDCSDLETSHPSVYAILRVFPYILDIFDCALQFLPFRWVDVLSLFLLIFSIFLIIKVPGHSLCIFLTTVRELVFQLCIFGAFLKFAIFSFHLLPPSSISIFSTQLVSQSILHESFFSTPIYSFSLFTLIAAFFFTTLRFAFCMFVFVHFEFFSFLLENLLLSYLFNFHATNSVSF